MCGIIGAVSKTTLPTAVDKFIKNALVVDSVRGAHSTGVCILSQDTKGKRWFEVRKEAICGGQFIEEVYNPTTDNGGVYAVIGHNRYATIGGITNETAHPFKVGDTVGVHNGTLTGDWKDMLDCGRSMVVDSNGLMHSLEHRGAAKTFSSISGAVATVWTNLKSNKTYVYRNYQRPLHYAKTTGGVLIYGSEKLMLAWLIDRNSIYITKEGIQSFNVNTVYEITGGEVTELESVEMFRDTSYQSNWSDYYSRAENWGRQAASNFTRSADDDTGTGTPNITTLPADDGIYGLDGVTDSSVDHGYAEFDEEDVTAVAQSVVSVTGQGLYPCLGGTDVPCLRDMYGSSPDMLKDGNWLPIRVPIHLSEQSLRHAGYKRQHGVWYRAGKVSQFERKHGVIAEFAELHEVGDLIPMCDWDGQMMNVEYLEETHADLTRSAITVHPENLIDWREAMSDYTTTFRKIIMKNVVHKYDTNKALTA